MFVISLIHKTFFLSNLVISICHVIVQNAGNINPGTTTVPHRQRICSCRAWTVHPRNSHAEEGEPSHERCGRFKGLFFPYLHFTSNWIEWHTSRIKALYTQIVFVRFRYHWVHRIQFIEFNSELDILGSLNATFYRHRAVDDFLGGKNKWNVIIFAKLSYYDFWKEQMNISINMCTLECAYIQDCFRWTFLHTASVKKANCSTECDSNTEVRIETSNFR